jgi:hypothetical protein
MEINRPRLTTKTVVYVEFDGLNADEKRALKELLYGSKAKYHFNKEYSFLKITIGIPFLSDKQIKIIRG